MIKAWVPIARILCVAIMVGRISPAAPGDVDATFTAECGVNGWVYAVTPLANGKLLVGGDFASVRSMARAGIARLEADGAVDQSFNPSHLQGTVVLSQAVQSDGKAVVAGYDSASRGWITRLNVDGTPDGSFTPPFSFGQRITKTLLQPDGKIIVAGLFSAIGGAPGDLVVRLNPNGSVDMGFNTIVFANLYSDVTGLRLQSDGKILVSAGGGLWRLNSDGSLDNSFSAAQFQYAYVQSFALQPNGKVLVGGRFHRSLVEEFYNVILLNNDGTIDTNFPPLGRGYTDVPAIEMDKDGRALISGSSSSTAEIIRLDVHHTNDIAFIPPPGAISQINTIAVDETNNVFTGGGFALPQGIANVARLRTNGSLDTSFQPGFSLTGVFVPAIALDAESRVVAALAAYNRRGMAVQRFELHGRVDTNFTMRTLRGEPAALTIQKDGKILVASQYAEGSSMLSEFKRLDADGGIDQSFRYRGTNEVINVAIEQPNGKIIIAGAFNTLNGRAADRVARLNSDGTIDNSFHSLAFFGSPFAEYDIARAVALQADGKILVGFQLGACGCEDDKRAAVLRLNSDGSYDSTFDLSAIVPSWVNTLLALPDGKTLVGGFQFSQSEPITTPRHGLIRLNADGSLDITFTAQLPIGSDVRAIAIDSSGKILLNSAHHVMRLNANGSTDSTFITASASGGHQYTTGMALAPDGNIYFCDAFDSVSGVARPRLARVSGTLIPIPLILEVIDGRPQFHWTNPALRLQSSRYVNGPYIDVIDSPTLHEPQQYYRLKAN